MVFVVPTSFTWIASHILFPISFVVAFMAEQGFFLFMQPYKEFSFIPHVNKNKYSMFTEKDQENMMVSHKVIIDLVLLTAFWLQHSLMARSFFKKGLSQITNGQYNYFERQIYNLVSGLVSFFVFMNFVPIPEVTIFEGFKGEGIKTFSLIIVGLGALILIASWIDNMPNDNYGFHLLSYFNREGNEFPAPLRMKNISRFSLICRNPISAAFIMIQLGFLLYDKINLGQLLFNVSMIAGIIVGNYFQEEEFNALGEKQYAVFVEQVPNMIIPDFTMLLCSREKVQDAERKIKTEIQRLEGQVESIKKFQKDAIHEAERKVKNAAAKLD